MATRKDWLPLKCHWPGSLGLLCGLSEIQNILGRLGVGTVVLKGWRERKAVAWEETRPCSRRSRPGQVARTQGWSWPPETRAEPTGLHMGRLEPGAQGMDQEGILCCPEETFLLSKVFLSPRNLRGTLNLVRSWIVYLYKRDSVFKWRGKIICFYLFICFLVSVEEGLRRQSSLIK